MRSVYNATRDSSPAEVDVNNRHDYKEFNTSPDMSTPDDLAALNARDLTRAKRPGWSGARNRGGLPDLANIPRERPGWFARLVEWFKH